jgi:hypothetical protein
MKALLLVTGLLLTGCSHHEQPVSRNPVVPAPVVQEHDHDTLEAHVIAARIDPSLVLPRLRQPTTLCVELNRTWQAYLSGHPTFKHRFPFESESLGYTGSFWLTIDRTGHVHKLHQLAHATAFGSCCYEALAPLLKQTVWSPYYKRTATGNRYASLDVHVLCFLSPSYRLSLQLDGMTMDDGGVNFFSCHQP